MRHRVNCGVFRFVWAAAMLLAAPAAWSQSDCPNGAIKYHYKSDRIEFDVPAGWVVKEVDGEIGLLPESVGKYVPLRNQDRLGRWSPRTGEARPTNGVCRPHQERRYVRYWGATVHRSWRRDWAGISSGFRIPRVTPVFMD